MNFSLEELYEITKIDPWFLKQVKEITDIEKKMGKADALEKRNT